MRDIRKSEESDLADSLVLWHCDSQQGVKRGVVEIGRKTVFTITTSFGKRCIAATPLGAGLGAGEARRPVQCSMCAWLIPCRRKLLYYEQKVI